MLKLENMLDENLIFGESLAKLTILMGRILIQTKVLHSDTLTEE